MYKNRTIIKFAINITMALAIQLKQKFLDLELICKIYFYMESISNINDFNVYISVYS